MRMDSTFCRAARIASVALLTVTACLGGCEQPEPGGLFASGEGDFLFPAHTRGPINVQFSPELPPLCVSYRPHYDLRARPLARADEDIACVARGEFYKAMYRRADLEGFHQLLNVLKKDFRKCDNWVVMEVIDSNWYGWVVLAETPAGYRAATNLLPWHDPDAPWNPAGRARRLRVDADKIEVFFQRLRQSELPDRLVMPQGPVWSVVVLHCSAPNAPRTVAVAGQEVLDLLMGFIPAAPQARISEIENWLGLTELESYGRRPDVVFPEPGQDRYDRIHSRYTALAADLYGITVGHPNLPELGGLRGAVRHVRKAEQLHGASHGESGSRGTFFRLALAVGRDGSPDDVRKLLKHPDVHVRMLGMAALASTGRVTDAEAFGNCLGSSARCDFVNGCVLNIETEAGFARLLLGDVGHVMLRRTFVIKPLLKPRDLAVVDVRLLPSDALYKTHLYVEDELATAVYRKVLPLRVGALQAEFPELPLTQVVKALGRIFTQHPDNITAGHWPDLLDGKDAAKKLFAPIRSFVICCLLDESLPADCRLAAASALTIDDDPSALKALIAAEEGLNGLPGDRLGSRLLALARKSGKGEQWYAELRRGESPPTPDQYLKLMTRRLRRPSRVQLQQMEDYRRLLLEPGCPSWLPMPHTDSLFDRPEPEIDSEVLARAKAAYRNALAKLAEMDFCTWRPWDTHGQDIYVFADFLDEQRHSLIKLLGKRLYERVRRKVRSQIKKIEERTRAQGIAGR